MSKKNKKTANLFLILGILGFLTGMGLMFSENWFIGIFGSIASAGLAYKGYQETKELKN
tara:strand:+ start:526 stop:702 length:177 start_codon:yes stop_codon:yes gene_type:complete